MPGLPRLLNNPSTTYGIATPGTDSFDVSIGQEPLARLTPELCDGPLFEVAVL